MQIKSKGYRDDLALVVEILPYCVSLEKSHGKLEYGCSKVFFTWQLRSGLLYRISMVRPLGSFSSNT